MLFTTVLTLLFTLANPSPSDWPSTRAEATEYRETSRYEDVIRFLDDLRAKGAPISIRYIGESQAGRKIPLAIASQPPVASPDEARRSGKAVVYIQANIHGGEVEGKEASLMLLRRLAQNPKDPLLDKVILLVAPIYNIDGNEKWGDGRRNRSSQDGPEVIGERANGQGLDLNRDCMKAEGRETRAALEHIYTTWDPDVVMDLHTTDGTRHGYHLTYAPALNPNTEPGIQRFTRDLLATVRKRLKKEEHLEIIDYGNLQGQADKRGWYTFGEEGRYVTNYVGLRNRVAILSEAASFLPFKIRVQTTLRFAEAILEEIRRDPRGARAVTRDADRKVIGWGKNPDSGPQDCGVRFEMASRGIEPIILEKPRQGAQIDPRKAPTEFQTVDLPVYDRFKAARTAKLPAAYLIPAAHSGVVDLLRRHGIAVEKITRAWSGPAQEFIIDELAATPAGFRGPRLNRLEGRFQDIRADLPAGTYVVRAAQPLGILIFHLLEPESLDGVAAWGFLDGSLGIKRPYPIRKVFEPVNVPSEIANRD